MKPAAIDSSAFQFGQRILQTALQGWRYLVLGSALVCALHAHAQEAVQRLSQMGHTVWRIQDESFNSPNSLTQSSDGYIWIGTNAGLVRFDGVRFVPWNTFGATSIAGWIVDAVFAARDGSVWIASNTRVARIKDGAISIFKVPGRPLQFAEDDAGAIWFAQTRSKTQPVCRIASEEVRCYGTDGLLPYGSSVRPARNGGGFWVGLIGGLCRWIPGTPAQCFLREQLKRDDLLVAVMSLEAARDAKVWVGIEKSGPGLGLGQLEHNVWKPFSTEGLDGSKLSVSDLLEDRNGSIWVASDNQGLYRITNGRAEHFGRAEGLSSDSILDLYEDREGTIWAVTSNGLDAFRPLPVSRFSMAEGLPTDFVQAVLPARDGSVWLSGKGVSVIRNGLVERWGERPLFAGKTVTAFLEDHAGHIWMGLDKRLHVYKDGVLTALGAEDGAAPVTITSIVETTDHVIWALGRGPKDRLMRIRNPGILEDIPEKFGYPVYLAPDPRGGLWRGYRNGDLVFRKDDIETLFAADATSNGAIADITVTADGTVLAATAGGLLVQRGAVRALLDTARGLPCSTLRAIVRDRLGDVWVTSECGVIGISMAEINQWLAHRADKVRYRLLDVNDGAQLGSSSFRPAASLGPDGRLWFSNGKTASVIDPHRIVRNELPPPVHVEELTADHVTHKAAGVLKLPEQTRDIEIRYTALSFVVPHKVKFRYMLEGRDRDWQDSGTRRQAFYTDLPPGAYRFRVKASNNDGVWNEAGASLRFEIPPAFHQTNWFIVLCVLIAAGVLYGFYVIRLRQAASKLRELLAAKNDERERIARELHDTLLQSTQGLILRFQAASNRIPIADPTRKVLDKALERADEVLAEGRDRVRELRGAVDFDGDLAGSLAMTGNDLAQGRNMAFRTRVDGEPRTLDEHVKQEAYSIGREALVNAFRHSGASSIEVSLVYSEDAFLLRISDDGKGINAEPLRAGVRPGHWGLPGMRERALQIRGELSIGDGVPKGTTIDLNIPAAVAYEGRATPRSWFKRKLKL